MFSQKQLNPEIKENIDYSSLARHEARSVIVNIRNGVSISGLLEYNSHRRGWYVVSYGGIPGEIRSTFGPLRKDDPITFC